MTIAGERVKLIQGKLNAASFRGKHWWFNSVSYTRWTYTVHLSGIVNAISRYDKSTENAVLGFEHWDSMDHECTKANVRWDRRTSLILLNKRKAIGRFNLIGLLPQVGYSRLLFSRFPTSISRQCEPIVHRYP